MAFASGATIDARLAHGGLTRRAVAGPQIWPKGGQATVHYNGLTGDEARILAGQKQRRARDVGAVAVVPERAGAAGGLLGFLQVSAGAVATFVVSLAAPDTPVKLGLLLAAYAVGACACWFGLRRFVMRSAA